MIINNNIPALNTYRQMGVNQNNASNSMEKLASGLRINKAGDDAAGLAISEKMRGQIRGLDQASRNAQDGISMIQTAEGSLGETHNILQRMRELATQAANDTNVTIDREEIQKEMNQLTSEINRIGNTTEFNTQKLLNGGIQTAAVDVTEVTAGGLQAPVGAAALGVNTTSTAEQAGVFEFTIDNAFDTAGQTLTVDGYSVEFVATGAAADQIALDTDATAADQADALATLINGKTGVGEIGERFTAVADAAGKITLTEKTGQATGTALADPVVAGTAGAGTTTAVTETTTSVAEVTGDYDLNLTTALAAGESITFGGVTFDAGSGSAIDTDTATTTTAQAAALKTAIDADVTLSARFTVVDDGNGNLSISEKATQATGTDPSVSVTGATQQGEYSFDLTQPEDGSSITVDGEEFIFTDDSTHAGIAAGTHVAIGADADATAALLATAIDNNATLAAKYENASVTNNTISLTQEVGQESATEPVVTTAEEAGADGKFSANFQIGANSGQSLTLSVDDMRSVALKVSGDTAEATVTAKDSSIASYVATENVTDGTNNTSTEFALDVSSHDKATAAISVINDAIESVSAERSNLGATQNRLEHTISNLGTSAENLQAAESRVRDVDMAKEVMEMTKNNILAQASQAMLAQANQAPQSVLQLLG